MGPIIATQLTDQSVRYWRLTIAGLDMTGVGSAYRYRVRRQSIALEENGPGGVSALHFTIADPLLQCTLVEGDPVEFWDITLDRPNFLGFLQNVAVVKTAVGRELEITCIGIEALLDWMVMTPLTIPAGTETTAAFQACYYNATGVGWSIRAFGSSAGTDIFGTQEAPIQMTGVGFGLGYDVVFTGGESLRQALIDVGAAHIVGNLSNDPTPAPTIDFYSGLRVHYMATTSVPNHFVMVQSIDMDDLLVEDTMVPTPGRLQSNGVDLNLDFGGVVRGVYIIGANAAGSGLVSDGTGIPGPVHSLADDSSTTADIRNRLGASYLAQFSESARITTRFLPIEPTWLVSKNVRPGSVVRFYPDGQTWQEQTLYSVLSIRKTWPVDDLENWSVGVGGFAPSAVRASRRRTRDVRS